MARPTRRFDVPRELQVAALVTTAALPLARLFQPGGFTGVVLSAVVFSIGISWVARRLRLPAVIGLLMSVVGLLWYLAGRFYPHTLWGIFPTPSSAHEIINGVHAGVRQTIEDVVPVVASKPLLMFVAAGTWLSAWLADAAALWVGNPLLAIAATIPLFATPSTLVPSQRRWLDTGLYLAAAAWILFGEERARARRWRTSDSRLGWRVGPAARLALIGVVLIVLLTPFLPGYGAPPLLRTRGPGDRTSFNPFVAIQATLQRNPQVTLFTESTNKPTYLRLTTLEYYDGFSFRQAGARQTLPIGSAEIAPFEPNVKTQTVDQRYEIQLLAGPWLPAAYDPVSVGGVSGLKIETDTRSLVLPTADGLPPRAQYEVISQVPVLTAGDLNQPFTYDKSALAGYLQLPSSVPHQITDIAKRVAGALPTPYEKAVALQDYLRTNFTYNENVATDVHHSFKDLVEFLTKSKQGYCEQFAAAMAVLARTLGIPSRVAIGFGFGTQVGNEYTITTREAHAWPEIYFPGDGWVAFEPTPRGGVAQVPPYAIAPGAVNPSVGPSTTSTPTTTPSSSSSSSARRSNNEVSGSTSTSHGRPAWVIVAVIAGSAIALFALAVGIPFVVRAARRRRAHGPRSASVVRYAEFLAWCAGAGLGRAPGETPAEHAARLATETTDAGEPMERLAALVTEALWNEAPDVDVNEVADAAARAQAVLKGTLTRRQRFLAASGWGRLRPAA